MTDISILLVHGTFAVDAAWTIEGSPFRRAIETSFSAYGHHVHFERVRWTGKNWFSARLAAAYNIREHVLAARSAGHRIILVGHSHGGSAVSYFLKHYVEDASTVDTCVFLSTPFFTLKERPGLLHRVRAWTYASLFAGQLVILFGLSLASAQFGFETAAFYTALAVNALFAAALLHLYRAFDPFARAISRVRAAVEFIIRERDSCDLPQKRFLFVKFSGDEASVGLSFAQSVAYGSNQVIQRGYQLFSKLRNAVAHRLPGPLREIVAVYFTAGWLLCSPFLASYTLSYDELLRLTSTRRAATELQLKHEIDDLKRDIARQLAEYSLGGGLSNMSPEQRREARRYYNHLVFSLQEHQSKLGNVQIDSSEFLLFRLVQVIYALSVASSLLFVAVVTFSFLTALCLAAFGSLSLIEVLFMETSVEVVPHGNHVLHHMNWREEPEDADVLRHSQVYSSSNSVALIANWMASQYASETSKPSL